MTNCAFVAGDAYELARLWLYHVDLVFLANAFHGVPDRPRLARSVAQVLKPSGRFAIVNWYPRPREETTVLGSRAALEQTCEWDQSKRPKPFRRAVSL
jgi:SAM-dependent methyltransferase